MKRAPSLFLSVCSTISSYGQTWREPSFFPQSYFFFSIGDGDPCIGHDMARIRFSGSVAETTLGTDIKTCGHLTNIPSAKVMEENGIHLRKTNMKLFEKIEELALYILELKKENQNHTREIKSKSSRTLKHTNGWEKSK